LRNAFPPLPPSGGGAYFFTCKERIWQHYQFCFW
jgi:hypothetical protein